ncbi:hypothetical protein A3C86_03680 [Candidatus Kaiserbacteria bacterium RIFCSPHIGHO2_02_FULL_49_16]|uniref:Uncharacterized protein n=1 Tax=Candidatus Kaiserbacteria bacterium RIFCSPHIGHO2_02_FULL_49_16 TaxID=1798490 RepID=A0A1F6D9V1_9BACT|nr:MAG: hypothetical protein A3C86_03680 [Candidatus Kaiserbacteria bacterium RIFCSPHIGHO2_02_FULL_49_16]
METLGWIFSIAGSFALSGFLWTKTHKNDSREELAIIGWILLAVGAVILTAGGFGWLEWWRLGLPQPT